MSLIAGYAVVTTTGAAIVAASRAGGYHLYGYCLKVTATDLTQIDITDNGTALISMSASSTAPDTKIFPVGTIIKGTLGLSGTATAISYVTLFYKHG